MTRLRWILVAQLAALPLVALALWLHGREQAGPQGGAVHEPAPAATIQPIPSEEPLPAQPVVAWTPKDDFDPMHVQNLDVVAEPRSWAIRASAQNWWSGTSDVACLYRAWLIGDFRLVREMLARRVQIGDRENYVVGIDEDGVKLRLEGNYDVIFELPNAPMTK